MGCTYTTGLAVTDAVGEARDVMRVAEEDSGLDLGLRSIGNRGRAVLAAHDVVVDLATLFFHFR